MTLLEVEKKIGKSKMKSFQKWMYGQTCGLVNGLPDYYEGDVNQFIKYDGDWSKLMLGEID